MLDCLTKIFPHNVQGGKAVLGLLVGLLMFSAFNTFVDATCLVWMLPVMVQRMTVYILVISKFIVTNISVKTVRHSIILVKGVATSLTA